MTEPRSMVVGDSVAFSQRRPVIWGESTETRALLPNLAAPSFRGHWEVPLGRVELEAMRSLMRILSRVSMRLEAPERDARRPYRNIVSLALPPSTSLGLLSMDPQRVLPRMETHYPQTVAANLSSLRPKISAFAAEHVFRSHSSLHQCRAAASLGKCPGQRVGELVGGVVVVVQAC